jgi:aminomethyltransferase
LLGHSVDMSTDSGHGSLARTALYDLHLARGARMVAFAGFAMPLNYPLGILKEHLHTRAHAGLFDVSHMGQAVLIGPDHATSAAALEALLPADILNLRPGQQRYSQLLDESGGIVDDLMVTRPLSTAEDGRLLLVVNASRREVDYAHIRSRLPAALEVQVEDERSLIALQGPAAAARLARLAPAAAGLAFMTASRDQIGGVACHISRSGYTGEDGFEISVASGRALALAELLLAEDGVAPIGLGARDSLRLEAGLCLYGHDLDTSVSPVEAGLQWSIPKRRRSEGGFAGAQRIIGELAHGPARRRVGIKPEGRVPAREGTAILSASGAPIGTVTSGGFGPSVNAPVAMGYVAAEHAKPGTSVKLIVRGRALSASIVPLPFVAHRYAGKSREEGR